MTEESEFNGWNQVVKVPISVIEKIILCAQSAPITEECDSDCNVRNAIGALGYKWAVIYDVPENGYRTAGFSEYDDCSQFVADHYNTSVEILYVLREGTPRKNVKVQVKARL